MDKFMNYNFNIEEIVVACLVRGELGSITFTNRRSHGLVFYTKESSNFEFDGVKTLTPNANEIIYIPKGSNYKSTDLNYAECYAINFLIDEEIDIKPFCFKTKNSALFYELFKNAESSWRHKSNGYEMKCKSLLYDIIYNMTKEFELGYLSKQHITKIGPALDYIHHQYTYDNIQIKTLADLCDMSEVFFRKVFVKAIGIPPTKYINNLKLQRAKELLATNMHSITETALLSGFHDESYFSRFFKKNVGVSPIEYKNEPF